MKKIIFATLVALILASCGGLTQKTGPLYSLEVVKSVKLNSVDTSKMPNISAVKIQGNYVTLVIDGKEKDMSMFPSECMETVFPNTSDYYSWVFDVIAADYKRVNVYKYMDEFLDPNPDRPDFIAVTPYDGDDTFVYEVKGRVDIPRKYVQKYDETDFPELKFTNLSFQESNKCSDKAHIPAIISAAKSMTIKGRNVQISDGSKSVTLDIYSCSDLEYFDNQYYCYSFYTKTNQDCPKLLITFGEDPANGDMLVLIRNREADELVGRYALAHDDFKSWSNVERMITVNYPYEEEYEEWKNKYRK